MTAVISGLRELVSSERSAPVDLSVMDLPMEALGYLLMISLTRVSSIRLWRHLKMERVMGHPLRMCIKEQLASMLCWEQEGQ